MTQKGDFTTDEILAKLDHTSRKARTISITLTLLSVLILAVVSYITYAGVKDINDLEAKKDELKSETANLQIEYEVASNRIQKFKDNVKELSEVTAVAKTCIDTNSNCAEAKSILANVNTSVEAIITPISSLMPQKSPTITNTQNTGNTKSKVYVQITDESQRTATKNLIPQLRSDKFYFPGIELVKRPIAKTQVRYFNQNDRDNAQELVALLHKWKIEAVPVFTKLSAEKGLLEIWFSNDSFPQPQS